MKKELNAEEDPSPFGTSEVRVGNRRLIHTNKRKSLLRVVSKVLSDKEKGVVQDSIASKRKKQKRHTTKGRRPLIRRGRMQFDDEDNVCFLTQMVKLADQKVDKHDGTSSINFSELRSLVSKSLGHNLTHRQVYEKVRRLRNMYISKLNAGTGQNVFNDDATKDEIYKLCYQVWGDSCGFLKLHLEEDDGPDRLNAERVASDFGGIRDNSHGLQNVSPGNDMEIGEGVRAGIDSIDFGGIHDNSHSLENVSPGNLLEIGKGMHAGVDFGGSHDNSHGLENVSPGNDMEIDKGMHAVLDSITHFGREMRTDLDHGVAVNQAEKTIKLGGSSTQWDAQRVHGMLKDKHQELLHMIGKKCETFLEGMQTKLMTMASNALETRERSSVSALFNNGSCMEKMLASSMLECSKSVPKHLQDRCYRLRAEELKLLSEKLNLMLEICQLERENVEGLIRQL